MVVASPVLLSEPPDLVKKIFELGEWRWQELELGTYEEVKEAADYILPLRTADPGAAWLLEWYLVRADLWYLVRYVSSQGIWLENGTAGVVHESWIYDRCREIEAKCSGVVDIWSRFHWKSYLKTVNKEIQEALREPDVTILNLSHTRPLSKQFLSGIKREILGNTRLQELSFHPLLDGKYPDGQIFQAKEGNLLQCSLDAGIIVPRIGNPKEATFSAFGLVDSLPTSGHWIIRNLDDAVTKDSVTTPEQIEKVLNAWELSIPLGMPAGRNDEWIEGTFYNLQDLYHTMVDVRDYELRLNPCYKVDWEKTEKDEKGKIIRIFLHFDDDPVLYEKDRILRFEKEMGKADGSKNVSMQLYCDPNAGAGGRRFERPWLEFYDPEETSPAELMRDGNCLMLADSAGSMKRKGSDFTAFWTLSLRSDGCAYVVDMVRDRLSLNERATKLIQMHHRCRHTFYECRYERYGAMSDIEHIQYVLAEKKRRMRIIRVGGLTDKDKRIERLIPWFEDSRIILPSKFIYRTQGGERVDLVEQFIHDEYLSFPSSSFKDMLDGLSRMCDVDGAINKLGAEGKKIPLRLRFPGVEGEPEVKKRREYYRPKKNSKGKVPRDQRWLVA